MIHVIATINVQPGRRDDFLVEFHRLMPLVHAEDGCLEYGPAVDLDAGLPVPTPLRDDVVTIVEKWASLDQLKAHLIAPHMHEYRGRVKNLVASVQLQILKPV